MAAQRIPRTLRATIRLLKLPTKSTRRDQDAKRIWGIKLAKMRRLNSLGQGAKNKFVVHVA
jgi:hypothetical protein